MPTQEIKETYGRSPESVKSAVLALSVLIDRMGALSEADRDDFFQLLQAWRDASELDAPARFEEQDGVRLAMEEILAQAPVTFRAIPLSETAPQSAGLQEWSGRVGGKIRELRERGNLTQSQLADLSGLTQSHVGRLENAQHSATNFTLAKIAKALGVSVEELDPSL